ncbi:MAG TPA: TonB-dependent receptor [Caulobacteraceae bacterium]
MFADQPPPTVEEVVVRAAALPPRAGDAAFSRAEVEARTLADAARVDEALKQTPGVSLFRRNSSLAANPTTQGVSLRSLAPSGAGRALVTLDGVPLNDPFGGWVIWSQVQPEALGRATIVRGAGAGPYGAGALTGVVALESVNERGGTVRGDISLGEPGAGRATGVAQAGGDGLSVLLTAGGERSDGYVPVRERDRGAADTPLFLRTAAASARVSVPVGSALLSGRLGAYEEERGAGLAGAESRVRGTTGSLALTRQPVRGARGWRLQAWTHRSDLMNSSVAVAAERSGTTPANRQYETPATGAGFNAALRGTGAAFQWEAGVDARATEGEVRELFRFTGGAFTRDRRAGGETTVLGAYVEASRRRAGWLLTGGARVDAWENSGAFRIERDVATGAATLDERPEGSEGVTPSFRAGLRRDVAGAGFVRAAAYTGFRPPTLNELHRPFRVGNDITEANPALTPESLQGAEVGAGRETGPMRISATLFWNRLSDPITNVTIGAGPGVFPRAGFVPAGGVLRERRNAGSIEAIGLEAEGAAEVGEGLSVRGALSLTDARVDGGADAPQLTGKRPAQAPVLTLTAGADWEASERLRLSAQSRYESRRFEDDLNSRVLSPALLVDARAEWRLTSVAAVYVAADNVLGAEVEVGETATGVESFSAPRLVRIGLRVAR